MSSTAIAIENFPKTLKRYSTSVGDKELESIVTEIDTLRHKNPAVYDEKTVAVYLKERAKTLTKRVNEYFVASIANKFPLISDELFQLKRNLTIVNLGKIPKVIRDDTELEKYDAEQEREKEVKIKRIQVPLFAYTPLFNGEHTARLGKFSKIIENSWGEEVRRTVTIEAKLPGNTGSDLRSAYRGALSHYFGVLSKMFTNPVAGDIIYAEENFAKPEIGAIWIPTPGSLSICVDDRLIQRKNLDPAMVLRVGGNNYLVKTWCVDDEEPFEQHLKKYSVEDLKGRNNGTRMPYGEN